MKKIKLILTIVILIGTGCKDRPRSNPFDPGTGLDPNRWAPSNLQVEQLSVTQVKLTWQQEESHIEGFRIDKKINNETWLSGYASLSETTFEFIDEQAVPLANNQYRVIAIAGDNESDPISNSITPEFPKPTGLTISQPNEFQLDLTWQDNSNGEDGFRIDRQIDSGSWIINFAQLNANTETWTDIISDYGKSHQYRIYGFADNVNSESVVSTITHSINAPTNLIASQGSNNSILLNWDDNSSIETGYNVNRKIENGSFEFLTMIEENTSNYTDNNIINGLHYRYRVYAISGNDSSAWSNEFVAFYDCAGTWSGNTNIDCANDCGGAADLDTCGVCSSGNSGHTADSDQDCNGYCFGTAEIDDCGVCDDNPTNDDDDKDCAGICFGDTIVDCNDVCDGFAAIDECGSCTGGYTELETNYQMDCAGICFGDDISCLDCIDYNGNDYDIVLIGTQIWMAENLKVTHYRNGDEIPNITNNTEWPPLATGAYGDFNNNPEYANTYGRLYNWYAVDDTRDVCPEDWHVPTDAEWMELEMTLGMSNVEAHNIDWRGTNEGSKLAGNADLWDSGTLENDSEFDASGFLALPGGYRYYGNGNYASKTVSCYFWSSTAINSYSAWNRQLHHDHSDVLRSSSSWTVKRYGFSVRCVRDN
ncbi:MAG: fibronectin type III domain-containing protein [Candidatus Marinimicrobia bacterium]|nr:fibronectin type III domain-containing protein [Candidatus Neomarinimicrobiota bacterium]